MTDTLTMPPQVTLARFPRMTIWLVGAGGTGARVATMLSKVVREEDRIVVIDPDQVEARNCRRQHFVLEEVGGNKAEIVADRLRVDLPNQAITALVGKFWAALPEEIALPVETGTILLGCTDSIQARREMRQVTLAHRGVAWIDAGNDLRTGQVAMTLRNWPVRQLKDQGQVIWSESQLWERYRQREHLDYHWWVSAQPLLDHFPRLVSEEAAQAEANETPACGLRIDTQSVAINSLAASYVVAFLTHLTDELPSSSLGCTFSSVTGGATPIAMKQAIAGYSGFEVKTTIG